MESRLGKRSADVAQLGSAETEPGQKRQNVRSNILSIYMEVEEAAALDRQRAEEESDKSLVASSRSSLGDPTSTQERHLIYRELGEIVDPNLDFALASSNYNSYVPPVGMSAMTKNKGTYEQLFTLGASLHYITVSKKERHSANWFMDVLKRKYEVAGVEVRLQKVSDGKGMAIRSIIGGSRKKSLDSQSRLSYEPYSGYIYFYYQGSFELGFQKVLQEGKHSGRARPMGKSITEFFSNADFKPKNTASSERLETASAAASNVPRVEVSASRDGASSSSSQVLTMLTSPGNVHASSALLVTFEQQAAIAEAAAKAAAKAAEEAAANLAAISASYVELDQDTPTTLRNVSEAAGNFTPRVFTDSLRNFGGTMFSPVPPLTPLLPLTPRAQSPLMPTTPLASTPSLGGGPSV